VEQGRWRARGAEASSKFSASSNIVASKELRVNSLVGNQGGVWRQVGNVQGKLSSNLGAVVNAPSSPTSLERYRDLRGEAVRRFMSRARKGKRETLRLSDRVRIHIRATQKSVAFRPQMASTQLR
jgi:hypothetical protein